MKICIGTDHAGFSQKEQIVLHLKEAGYEVVDFGAYEYDENDDYPDFVSLVAKEVSRNPLNVKGIILGGSGQGEAMVANRFSHVRVTVFYGERQSLIDGESILEISRQHNDSNILSIGSRFITDEEAIQAVVKWLETPFSDNERHRRRVEKMEKLDRSY